MRFVLPALLLCLAATAHANQPPVGAMKTDWQALLAGKCDLDAHGVRTPIEASLLRNTPYAIQGYTFKTPELGMIFDSDGDWYVPKPNITPKFTPAEGACIKKLKDFEAALKAKMGEKAGSMLALKAATFVDRRAYFDLRGHSKLLVGGTPELTLTKDLQLDVRCPKCSKLQVFTYACEDDYCAVLVPGTGELPAR